MELDKVKELVEMMKANDLSEIEIVDGQTRIMLKRGGDLVHPVINGAVGAVMPMAVGQRGAVPGLPGGDVQVEGESGGDDLHPIVSPIVGTFYSAPSPTSGDFVKVGDTVDEDTVVCIIEAMKVMNEIKAGVRGRIKKVLVENGSSLEFDQPIFLVEQG